VGPLKHDVAEVLQRLQDRRMDPEGRHRRLVFDLGLPVSAFGAMLVDVSIHSFQDWRYRRKVKTLLRSETTLQPPAADSDRPTNHD